MAFFGRSVCPVPHLKLLVRGGGGRWRCHEHNLAIGGRKHLGSGLACRQRRGRRVQASSQFALKRRAIVYSCNFSGGSGQKNVKLAICKCGCINKPSAVLFWRSLWGRKGAGGPAGRGRGGRGRGGGGVHTLWPGQKLRQRGGGGGGAKGLAACDSGGSL